MVRKGVWRERAVRPTVRVAARGYPPDRSMMGNILPGVFPDEIANEPA